MKKGASNVTPASLRRLYILTTTSIVVCGGTPRLEAVPRIQLRQEGSGMKIDFFSRFAHAKRRASTGRD
jgi:hypothetical protein